MDRKLFKLPFRDGVLPAWQCPNCHSGILTLIEDSFASDETSNSQKAREHEAWDPDWIESVYSCRLRCSNSNCGEIVVSGGTGNVVFNGGTTRDCEWVEDWKEYYRPKYFVPHLKIFRVPDDAPHQVSDSLNQSFALFFVNADSAANHVRVALEHVLTDLKVARYQTGNGRRQYIALHNRILQLPSKHSEIKDLCLAVKWLGNAGSHSSHVVTTDDVLDAYEIMDTVLSKLYDPKHNSAKKLAKAVNKRKGPVKRDRKKSRRKKA